ncbi:MAG TPA: hypothetical protein VLG28_03200 [Acidimicrobiia bacterium]|jgi:hypothetical protein|nr:hypothetical protein [Acidimicrobiia bacterium]
MTDADVVFAKFVDANPVPDLPDLEALRPDVTTIISGGATRIDKPRSAAPTLRRGAWAAAAALLLVLAVGGLLLVWPDQPVSQPAQPQSPEEVLRQNAVSTAEDWLSALNAGDIDLVMALSGPEASSEADRRVHEWQAGLLAQGMPIEVRGCVVASVAGTAARVECEVRLGDLVAIELGVADLVAPFDYSDGLITWRPYTGGNIGDVNDAYAGYLRRFHAAEYETLCSPSAYSPGTAIQDRGLALTGECAQLAAPLAADIAQWIRDGRPEEQP